MSGTWYAGSTDADNDGVPDNADGDVNSDDDLRNILLSNSSTGATIEVPFGYRVALGNTARRIGHTQAQLDLGDDEGVVGSIGIPSGHDGGPDGW